MRNQDWIKVMDKSPKKEQGRYQNQGKCVTLFIRHIFQMVISSYLM